MVNPNKINNQIIKNHNKKIKDIPDGKFFLFTIVLISIKSSFLYSCCGFGL